MSFLFVIIKIINIVLLELIMLYCDIKFLTRIIYADIGIIYATYKW